MTAEHVRRRFAPTAVSLWVAVWVAGLATATGGSISHAALVVAYLAVGVTAARWVAAIRRLIPSREDTP
ncbi:hypothetical protein STSO111631_21325 [Stackebrandtia soli]